MTHEKESARWQRVREIVADALDLPAADRSAFIAAACGNDGQLRRDVDSLVAADAEQPEDFLAVPAAVLAGAVLASGGPQASGVHDASRAAGGDAAGSPHRTPGAEESGGGERWLGREIGGYTIQRLLGQGGMGLVFEALQESPRRLVALKLLRGGVFVDDLTLRLFQREAEALARLQHPGIAAIYESGRTGDDLHYFAMELVPGLPLDAYLAGSALADSRAERRRRLAVFLEIAEAIAHAHQRGVIHRDLKPSNVVVREDGRVQVLDFGLARITEGDVALATIASTPGAIQGTLPYMSPEQAAGDPAAIDLRSDVYSLGVLLYEMLTGALPIAVRGTLLPDALRAIAAEPPRRPTALVPSLEADLETILLTALQKDPRSRYATVDALAEDVRRFLADLPILARPASTLDQLRRLARRHRVVVALGATILAVLVAGVIGTTAGMLRARAAEREARAEAATARAVSEFLENLFLVSDPGEARGSSVTARELLDRASVEVDSALVAEPRVRGRLLGVLGQVYRNLGLYAEARPLLERSLAVRSANPEESPLELARSYFSLAGLLRRLGQFEAAGQHYAAALRIREANPQIPPEELAASYQGLANLYFDEGRYPEALTLAERGLEMARQALGEDHYDYPSFLSSYAFMLYGNGELERARATFEETVRRREAAHGADHPLVGFDLRVLADLLAEMGLVAEAVPVARRALTICEATLGAEHPTAAEARSSVGVLELELGHARIAEEEQRRALAVLEMVMGGEHHLVGSTLDHLAEAVAAQGRRGEALELVARAGTILDAALPPGHESLADHADLEARIRAASEP